MAAKVFNITPNPASVLPGPQLQDAQALYNAVSGNTGASTQDAITASTTQTQVGGTAIDATFNRITVANASDAITLSRQAVPGRTMVVTNVSGQTIQLFPKLGDAIGANAVNAAVSVATARICTLRCAKSNVWDAFVGTSL